MGCSNHLCCYSACAEISPVISNFFEHQYSYNRSHSKIRVFDHTYLKEACSNHDVNILTSDKYTATNTLCQNIN